MTHHDLEYPEGKTFAFSIFDDTDNSTIANTRPVYELLQKLGLRTTKSVWVEPPRGPSSGDCLRDPGYRDWILELQSSGFEIGFHGPGDGHFERDEILNAFEDYRRILGSYPAIHANHQANTSNVYWWQDRFPAPYKWLYSMYNGLRGRGFKRSGGEAEGSEVFWGDVLSRHIRYVRNLTFNHVNTLACDPCMPYRRKDTPLANYWFSSSDGHTVEEFNDLICPSNLDRLEHEGGCCIVYTHFASGFVDESGRINPIFQARMEDLASRNGWHVPVTRLLDHLQESRNSEDDMVNTSYLRKITSRWILQRIRKRLRYGR